MSGQGSGPHSTPSPTSAPSPEQRARGKNALQRWYELQAGYGLLGRARARREQRPGRYAEPPPELLPAPRFEVEGEANVAPFLVTTTAGLFLWSDHGFRALMPGTMYGLAVHADGDAAFAFQQTGGYGRIVELRGLSGLAGLSGPSGTPTVETRIWGLSRWVHQIDLVGTRLVVTDTDRNRLLFFDPPPGGGPVHASAATRAHFVGGDARASRESPNYHHINSVVRRGDRLYVMAHNHSVRTGRPSEMYVFDDALEDVEVLPTQGRCCHNICFADGAMLWCRSLEGTLSRDGVDVARTDGFTRGLAVNGDTVLLGISRLGADRTGSAQQAVAIEIYSRDFTRRGRITLAAGQVREIRFLRGDLGMSNTAEPEAAPGPGPGPGPGPAPDGGGRPEAR